MKQERNPLDNNVLVTTWKETKAETKTSPDLHQQCFFCSYISHTSKIKQYKRHLCSQFTQSSNSTFFELVCIIYTLSSPILCISEFVTPDPRHSNNSTTKFKTIQQKQQTNVKINNFVRTLELERLTLMTNQKKKRICE